MNEQMHGSIISLPLDLLYSAQFLFSESIFPGRQSVGWGSRRSGKGTGEGSKLEFAWWSNLPAVGKGCGGHM